MLTWMINGQFWVVFEFGCINSSITKVYVKLEDKNAGKKAMPNNLYATKYKVAPTQRIDANIIINKNSFQIFKKTQFPLTLTPAWTIHKVPSLTLLNSTVVSLELIKQRLFSSGQIFVPLYLSTSMSKSNILFVWFWSQIYQTELFSFGTLRIFEKRQYHIYTNFFI